LKFPKGIANQQAAFWQLFFIEAMGRAQGDYIYTQNYPQKAGVLTRLYQWHVRLLVICKKY
jgi:hypothetical protein